MFKSLLLTASLLSIGSPDGSLEPITDSLHAVTVTADKGVIISRTDILSVKNSFTITDVLLQSPGLHVGDNGGLSGLKTVSLRGMGSAHTTIYLDGVRIGNMQSGQNDLGMLGLENVKYATVDYAQNSVSFTTARPIFLNGPVAGKASFSAGSFGTWIPSLRLDFRLSDRISLSANAGGTFSKGNFTYSDQQVRTNNDLKQMRAGVDLFGSMDNGEYHVKAFFNRAERGTPGPTEWPSDDRQKDMNTFIQSTFSKKFSPLYTLRLSGKSSYDSIYYTSTWGDSQYDQSELQLNSAHDFQIKPWWKLSAAADLQWDDLKSSAYEAARTTVFTAIASSFITERIAANLALEYNGSFDRGALVRHYLSPSVDIRYSIMKGLDIMAFGRRAHRVPTFNELYYVGYGNPDLKPEDAWLTDIGLDFERSVGDSWSIRAKANAFYNRLTNKITSAPTPEDPAIWQPYNIGKVRSAGFDLTGGFSHEGTFIYSFDAKYSYQSALDITPDSYTFGSQIPYIARHTIILNGTIGWKGWELHPLWQLRAGRRDGTGDLPAWNTLDLVISKSISFDRTGSLTLKFASRNIMDCRYETVSGYPMPGRNFLGGIEYSL